MYTSWASCSSSRIHNKPAISASLNAESPTVPLSRTVVAVVAVVGVVDSDADWVVRLDSAVGAATGSSVERVTVSDPAEQPTLPTAQTVAAAMMRVRRLRCGVLMEVVLRVRW